MTQRNRTIDRRGLLRLMGAVGTSVTLGSVGRLPGFGEARASSLA